MKLPAFIKQLARICDSGSSGYALGCVQCKSDGQTASVTATDGRILASVHWQDDDASELSTLADAKALASPPVKAFASAKGVHFDGSQLHGEAEGEVASDDRGRFPDCEKVMTIHEEPDGYVAVKLDAALLGKLCSLSHAMNDDTNKGKGITLFVKDARSCVFASTAGEDGHVARFAIMPLAYDDAETKHEYPSRPNAGPAKPEPADRRARPARAKPAAAPRQARATTHDFSTALPALD